MKLRPLCLAAIAAFAGLVATASAQPATWPSTLPSDAGTIRLYQPQIDGYNGASLSAHAAVSVTPAAGGNPNFGVVFFDGALATDRASGLATLQSINVTKSSFPSAAPGTADAVTQALSQATANGALTFSQSQLIAQLATTQSENAAAAELDNTPPQILFATQPSVLVSLAGAPKLVAAPDSPLMTVVNSPFFIALDPTARTYYLQGGGQWFSAPDLLQGPWTAAASVPPAVTALASRQPAAANTPATPTPALPPGTVPQIFVATQPTELIQTTGPAEYAPIANTDLLYVSNTTSAVFMDIDSQALYVLLSGRWFTAATQAGPWTYVPPAQLPGDFSRIPAGLPISNVLASIPGTQPARDAAIDAQIPQTANVRRDATAPSVSYDGKPKFEPVTKGSPVTYAANTSHAVVQVKNHYYLCFDGVWYRADAATGPWVVCESVPTVIYTIPPSCPIYPVTYVRIYGATPDYVTFGYLPGYTGSFVVGGAVVYGTGWSYPAWYGSVFIPRLVTWGFGASFAFGGGWGFSVGAGWGVASFGCAWNSGWWGWGNNHWNNWNFNSNWNQQVNINRQVTNNYYNSFNRNGNNIYRNNPNALTPAERQRLAQNDRHLADENDRLQRQLDRERAENRTLDRNQAAVDERQRDADAARARADRDDVYADRDGNVYRHTGDSWQQRAGDRWADADREAFRRQQPALNRQFAARVRGNYGGGRRR